MRKYHSPKIARWLLEYIVAMQDYSPIVGDFEEAYCYMAESEGRYRAIVWYWGQIIRSLPGLIYQSIFWSLMMFKNYLKIAVRNLMRNKGYSAINIFGLAIGMACCTLIFLYIQDELSYDRFHEKTDRIYRLTPGTNQDNQPTNANGSFSAAPTMAKDFPEVLHAVRFRKMGWGEKRVIAHEDQRFYEEGFFFADSNVFEVFTYPMIYGDPKTALKQPFSLVITEAVAAKYFDMPNPLGKSLKIDPYNDGDFQEYQITGVIKNLPANAHLQFDFLAAFDSQKGRKTGWGLDAVYSYVLLHPDADAQALESRLYEWQEKYMGADPWFTLHLQPLADARLYPMPRGEPTPGGSMEYIYIFSAIAVFILLIACINFMNLSTARSSRRAREVGIRKVMGAFRRQLIKQFLGEAILLSLAGVLLAFLLVELLLPYLNDILDKRLAIEYRENLELVAGMLGLGLFTGILAGSYPALFLSSFQPINALRGSAASKERGGESFLSATGLRKVLVVCQFAISVMLIICTTVVYNQMSLVRSKNLGFDRELIVVAPVNDEIRQNYGAFKQEILNHPDISFLSMTEQVPAKAGNGAGYRVEGQEHGMGLTRFFVDHDFAETYGVEMLAGRDFDEAFATDSAQAFIINETLWQRLGWASPEEAIGKGISMSHSGNTYEGNIIGVMKDFHLFSFRDGLSEVVLNIMPMAKMNFISFRIQPREISQSIAHLQSNWRHFSPSYPFDYYFLDEDFARLHQADERLGKTFRYFAFLAIFVACLGLLGLAAFTAEQRTREIGIRKVLGASVGSIVLLLSKEFTRWVILSNLIAWPLAYLAMSQWLKDFAFRIELGVDVFLISAAIAFIVALATVSLQTIKAALSNPIDSLRYE